MVDVYNDEIRKQENEPQEESLGAKVLNWFKPASKPAKEELKQAALIEENTTASYCGPVVVTKMIVCAKDQNSLDSVINDIKGAYRRETATVELTEYESYVRRLDPTDVSLSNMHKSVFDKELFHKLQEKDLHCTLIIFY